MRLLSFDDLREMGIARNREWVQYAVKHYNFPAGILIGSRSRRYPADQVEAWLANRPVKGEMPKKKERAA